MVLQQRREPYPHWEYTDPSGAEVLRVVPERGGLVTGWSSLGRDWLYFDAERFADPDLSVRGGIPVLFPICGGLPDGRLPLPQGVFTLAQHGFARDRAWELSALEGGDGVRLTLAHDPHTLAAFPFLFRLSLEYRLAPGQLGITAQVANAGEDPMPFSFGLHPYWAVDDLSAVRLEGLPAEGFDHHTMAPATLAAQLEALGEGVDLLAHPAGPVRLRGVAGGAAVTLEPDAPLDLVVLWTDPPRPMVCLEPWTAPRGALISGDRRLLVDPGGCCSLSCRYRVDRGWG
ncbi:galactose mutarotase [Cyanobium sp. NIES-981]|uniref:aldose epimerase family protein n=1 Tax=Cyanobium sp. NIES-981 TaxID=1851505 RepID=UPI0007DCE4FD|nr:galactose mutarotase [Cyanobium sp. NIES-981]SBO43380.1 Aldose 1-epimerase subfamily protein [Cyanobium sp. NIES-981]